MPGNAALKFVILLGLVSLFADMTYEGARSITGPYLAALGASGTAVGIISGFGELVGYGLRLVSGYFSDRTGKYWAITIAGYGVNLLAVPLLALAGNWEIAATLMIAERMGKAIRTPARDAMLSHATVEMGRGWGFGLHEAMDQIGATLGPLIVAGVYALRGSYHFSFAILLVPALMALGVLVAAKMLYPRPREFESAFARVQGKGLPRIFWVYLGAVGLIAAGYADFPLIAYHVKTSEVTSEAWIPLLYAVAMGVDALAALVLGRLFDRIGISTLIFAGLVSLLFAPLVFRGNNAALVFLGMTLWGVGMGAQESIMRALVAQTAPPEKRASAYGIFNAAYGLSWFIGSALIGVLYDISIPALIAFSMGAQFLSIPILLHIRKRMARPKALKDRHQ